MWNYAELSKLAKKTGSPEKLLSLLFEMGKNAGYKEMYPLIGIAVGVGALGYAGISKLINLLREREKVASEALKVVKEELVQGIKEYDRTHSDEQAEEA